MNLYQVSNRSVHVPFTNVGVKIILEECQDKFVN